MHWLPVILLLPYLFLLLCIYRSLLRIKPFNVSTDPFTNVSLIVACRNEKDNIPELLNCIARQDYPNGLFEVIIVDDNSTDGTFEAASGFSGIHNIIVIKNRGTGKKQAIKTGINVSSGILIITTDADCRMGESWIRTIATFYEKYKPDMIICPVMIDSVPGFFNRFQELEFLSLQGITAGSSLSGNGIMCNGANLSFTRETYLNHMDNLHNEISSGDDVFLLHSLKKQNQAKILWLESKSVMVTASSAPSLLSFLKQRKRWISKVKAYEDKFTILLGIVTFVTIIVQLSVMVAGLINPSFIAVFITIFLLKSVPDFMILMNTSVRYGIRNLMTWFLPAQFLYPFYVLCVVAYSLIFLRTKEY
jgi:poly-beta-1,6-N-acetyl-D-glucosamine synthase